MSLNQAHCDRLKYHKLCDSKESPIEVWPLPPIDTANACASGLTSPQETACWPVRPEAHANDMPSFNTIPIQKQLKQLIWSYGCKSHDPICLMLERLACINPLIGAVNLCPQIGSKFHLNLLCTSYPHLHVDYSDRCCLILIHAYMCQQSLISASILSFQGMASCS